jgi:hypothetical protein
MSAALTRNEAADSRVVGTGADTDRRRTTRAAQQGLGERKKRPILVDRSEIVRCPSR